MHLVSWFGNIWVGRGGMIPTLRRRCKIPEFPPVAFLVFLWRSFVGVAAAGWQMWIYWGKAPPSPLSVQAGAVWLHRFPIKYMAADALWVMPICLLAALAADAVINHCVTGWQCPSLTSGWLRRARFLPALTKKSSELRRAALEMLLWNCKNPAIPTSWISNALFHTVVSPSTLQTIKLGIRECTSSALLFFCHLPPPQSSVLCMQTASPVCFMRSDTKLLGRLCGVANFFFFLGDELVQNTCSSQRY